MIGITTLARWLQLENSDFVFNDSKDLNHTPDFILFSQEKKINIEIEITKKTEKRYKEIIFKSVKDGAD